MGFRSLGSRVQGSGFRVQGFGFRGLSLNGYSTGPVIFEVRSLGEQHSRQNPII